MSIDKFNESKKDLAFSQGILDKLNADKMAQQSGQMSPMTDQQVVDSTQQPIPTQQEAVPQSQPEVNQQEKGIVDNVVERLKPIFESLKEAITSKKDKQEVQLKIDAEMSSVEDPPKLEDKPKDNADTVGSSD